MIETVGALQRISDKVRENELTSNWLKLKQEPQVTEAVSGYSFAPTNKLEGGTRTAPRARGCTGQLWKWAKTRFTFRSFVREGGAGQT